MCALQVLISFGIKAPEMAKHLEVSQRRASDGFLQRKTWVFEGKYAGAHARSGKSVSEVIRFRCLRIALQPVRQ